MIYILGTERSASTWVANILDHHPQMDVLMEPLSSYNSRFKNWPNRFTRFDRPEKRAADFKKEFEILWKHRRFLLTHFSNSQFAWQTDLSLAHFLVRKSLAPDSVMDFAELNFHRKNRQIGVKNKDPLHNVIKEVRLNFNAELITALNENPRVIVTIREMASSVQSMLTLIEAGSLTDLKKDLQAHYGSINPEILCRYWYESYSVLLEALEKNNIPHEIVSHTDLLKNSIAVSEKIFRFLDLPLAPQVTMYLDASNKSGKGAHSTNRNREELMQQIKVDREHIFPLIGEKLLHQIQNHPILRKFV